MDLFIIRHAESSNNRIAEENSYETFVASRVHEPEITELGHEQASALAEHIATSEHAEFDRAATRRTTGYGIDRLIVSPMTRALQTAAPVADALHLPLEVWVDIHEHGGLYEGSPSDERSFRTFPGKPRSQILREFPTAVLPDDMTEEGWWRGGYEEVSGCEARAERVARRLIALAASAPNCRVAMVSHGTFVNHLLRSLMSVSPDAPMYFFHSNTGISRVEFTSEHYHVLRYLNRISHLPTRLQTR
jgi:broad specificity phosphatase PhoE